MNSSSLCQHGLATLLVMVSLSGCNRGADSTPAAGASADSVTTMPSHASSMPSNASTGPDSATSSSGSTVHNTSPDATAPVVGTPSNGPDPQASSASNPASGGTP